MKTQKVIYWAATSLVAFASAAGGAMDLAGAPPLLEAMAKLGYPAYLATLLAFGSCSA